MLDMRLTLVAMIAIFAGLCARADSTQTLFDPARHMHVSEVRPGMTGYGLSVFKGTKIEKFDVEVLSVLKNFNPKYDVVLITCKGMNLEHTGAIAGMSGSPIFLKDDEGRERMIGAFAYGFPMAKDPIAGVQPIEYMLSLPTTQPADTSGGRNATAAAKAQAEKKITWPLREAILLPGMKSPPRSFPLLNRDSLSPNPMLGGAIGSETKLQPLVTPLAVSGVSSKVLDQFAPLFDAYGLHMIQTGSAVSAGASPIGAIAPIEPGSVLTAPLITGDIDLVATGTCTERIGDSVFAFGHAFNNEGPIDIPMGSGQINGIIATLVSSFKLGSMTQVQGALKSDQTVGVAGKLGSSPAFVPMELRIVYSDGSGDTTFKFNSIRHPRFTPLIVGFAVNAVLSGVHDLPQYHTLDYDVNVEFPDGRSVRVQNSAVNVQPQDLFLELATPMIAASENPFERVMPTKVSGTITVTPEAREAQILSVNMPKLKFRAGETVRGYLTYRPFHAAEATLPIAFELPKDLTDGDYQLVVSDWQRYLTDEQANKPFKFEASSINDVFGVLKDMSKIRHNAVYLRLVRQPDGVAVGRTEMPRLPASMRNVLLGSGRSNTTAYVSSTMKSIPTQLVMSGSAEFQLTIDNELRVEVGNNPPTHAEPGKPQPKDQAAPKPDESKKPKFEPLPGQQP
jgi:hypothetical protein